MLFGGTTMDVVYETSRVIHCYLESAGKSILDGCDGWNKSSGIEQTTLVVVAL